MKQVRGFWLPDHEEHLIHFIENGPEFAGGPTYQLHKLMACMPLIKNFGHAVDIGAHCGLWSRVLAQMFTIVTAFEPVEEHRACLWRNLRQNRHNVTIYECALGGVASDLVFLSTGANSSGDTTIQALAGEHSAPMRTLDSFDLPRVDFLKIDCEGFEYFILQGGEQTVRKWKPTIIVEQKPGKGRQFELNDTAAVKLLESWGARVRQEISGDFIMTF